MRLERLLINDDVLDVPELIVFVLELPDVGKHAPIAFMGSDKEIGSLSRELLSESCSCRP